MSKWTQKQFNKDHAEPREYGEGDAYIIGNQYTDAEAAKLICDFEETLTGDRPNFTSEDITTIGIVVGKNDDGEDDWCYSLKTTQPVAQGKAIFL